MILLFWESACVLKSRRELTARHKRAGGLPPALQQSVCSISGTGTVCTFLLNPRKNKKANTAVSLPKSANFAPSQEKKEFSWESWQWLEEVDRLSDHKFQLHWKNCLNVSKSHSYLIKTRARCEQSELLVLSYAKAGPSHQQYALVQQRSYCEILKLTCLPRFRWKYLV